MVYKNARHVFVILLLIAITGVACAGNAVRFVNLGFSPDSRTFMFAQHGIVAESGFPFAEIFTVDVPDNSFVSGGVVRETYDSPISPGQDGSGALYTLLPDLYDVIARYRISHLTQGRLIYLLVDGAEVRNRIEFRDFETGNAYTISISQDRRGSGDSVRASFYLDVVRTLSDGMELKHRVGRPGYYRDDIDRYRINQVIMAPDERSIVVVVERIRETASGLRIRYMVETVRLR